MKVLILNIIQHTIQSCSGLETEDKTRVQSLIVTWHGLERADTFWDEIKGRKYPEFATRTSATSDDYERYSTMTFDKLEQKYLKALQENVKAQRNASKKVGWD